MKTLVTRHSSLATALALAAASASAAGFRAAPVADYKGDAWSFGVSAGTAFVGGEAREHVFSPKNASADYAQQFGVPDDGRRHQLSRLDWDIAASMIGFSGSARRGRLSLNLGFWYGGSGDDDWEMEDYDWLAGDHVHYTEYSKSDTELTDAFMIDAGVSFDLWRDDAFTGYAFAGFRAQQWEWECDGCTDLWYSENGHLWTRSYGHICDYEQKYLFGYIGLCGTWKLSDVLEFSAYVSWAPRYMGKDHDKHLVAEKDFRETFDYDDGNVYAAGVELTCAVAENLKLALALDCQKTTLHEGKMKLNNYGEGEYDEGEDVAGYESQYAALSFGLNYTF